MDESVGVFLTCCALVGFISARWFKPPALLFLIPMTVAVAAPFGLSVVAWAWVILSAAYVGGCVVWYRLATIDLPRLRNQKPARAVQKSAE